MSPCDIDTEQPGVYLTAGSVVLMQVSSAYTESSTQWNMLMISEELEEVSVPESDAGGSPGSLILIVQDSLRKNFSY